MAGGADATITNIGLFGIDAAAFGRASSGSINVSTALTARVNAGGTGIIADNSAFAIPVRCRQHDRGDKQRNDQLRRHAESGRRFPSEGGGAAVSSAGILAGYDGGPVFENRPAVRYTSCGFSDARR